MTAPAELIPPNEGARLAAVRRFEILDSPPDGAFDRLTSLAARLFRVPVSIVTIVDHDRIWFKSAHGVQGVEEIGRDPGLCASAILHDDVWVVEQADIDPRALANPLVAGEFGLRFYAGAPLTTADGFKLGTLCVIDREPRAITAEEGQTLSDLAALVVDELELRLAARKEQERLEQTRTDFTVTASHQLRTPLAGIYGVAKTLAGSSDRLPEPERELVGVLETQSERLTEIVEKILLAARLEHGTVLLSLEPHDAIELASAALDAIEPIAANRRLSLFHGSVGRVVSDAAHTRQVLVNLLENAVNYSPDESEIELSVEAEDDRIRFRVRDEGVGIPADDQRRIFDKFVRLDAQMSSGVHGTGLGLSIAREFAVRMGGSLTVESRLGEGSTFTLELPAAA